MALIPPFKCAELATLAGTPSRPNEDYAAAGPGWAIVLDGATHFDGVDTGCIHDVSWLVGHLAAALAGQLILGRVMTVTDDRVDHLRPGGRPYTRALVRAKRNAPGGFWIASTNPRAAYEARSGTAEGPTHVALLTDGVTRLVYYYGYDWPEIFAALDRDGPASLIQRIRDAERTSPPPTHRYGKQHDDATAIYIRVS